MRMKSVIITVSVGCLFLGMGIGLVLSEILRGESESLTIEQRLQEELESVSLTSADWNVWRVKDATHRTDCSNWSHFVGLLESDLDSGSVFTLYVDRDYTVLWYLVHGHLVYFFYE